MTDTTPTSKSPLPDQEAVIEAIRQVFDPEIPVNIYDLGLIYHIEINDDTTIDIQMTLTTPNCPVAELIPVQVADKVKELDGVVDVRVSLVWEPAWTQDRMSEDAKLMLDMQGGVMPKPQQLFNISTPTQRRSSEDRHH